jgi:hypothetical protein
MSGKLYIGCDGTGLFKIGITRNHEKRLRQIRTANQTFHYLMVFNVDNPAVVEAEVHAKLSHRHYSGEWYSLTAQDLKWIYDKFSVEKRHTAEDFELVLQYIKNGIAMNLELREFLKQYNTVDGGES